MSEQCWAQLPWALTKQFGSLPQVVGSRMLMHTCEHVCSLLLHTHVESPLQSVAVERCEHAMAQDPVAVTLQSGRAWHDVPTNEHCILQTERVSSHSQMLDAAQLAFVVVSEQLSRQMPDTTSQTHVPAELSQPALVLYFNWQEAEHTYWPEVVAILPEAAGAREHNEFPEQLDAEVKLVHVFSHDAELGFH